MSPGKPGVLCPVCPAWFQWVDERWRDHVRDEHPATFAKLRRASSAGAELERQERRAARLEITREVEAIAALRVEVRERLAAVPASAGSSARASAGPRRTTPDGPTRRRVG